jgi:hypothetical protein
LASTVSSVMREASSGWRIRELSGFKRDELQDLLDEKAQTLSFSVVDHLRWDLKQIFDMAVAETSQLRRFSFVSGGPGATRHTRQ